MTIHGTSAAREGPRYHRSALDALPAEPIAAHYAPATATAAGGSRERALYESASHADYLYVLPLLALEVGAVALDGALKYDDRPGVRLLGPSAVGLAWGGFVGGGYLALPKCELGFVAQPAIEGDVRSVWPLALSLALLAGVTAPVLVGIETGALPSDWTTAERASRLALAGVTGFAGALVPYLIPPRTFRAARQLESLRINATARGVSLGVTVSF